MYNLTAVSNNASNIVGLFQGVNTELMNGALGILILLSICAVIFISIYKYSEDSLKATAATCIIAFVLALLLRAMDLVPDLAVFITLVLAAASIAASIKRGQ